MPKYYCDYCDVFLTHDSPSVRKSHNAGWKHKAAVKTWYSQYIMDATGTMTSIDPKLPTPLGVPPMPLQLPFGMPPFGAPPFIPGQGPPLVAPPPFLPPQTLPGQAPMPFPSAPMVLPPMGMHTPQPQNIQQQQQQQQSQQLQQFQEQPQNIQQQQQQQQSQQFQEQPQNIQQQQQQQSQQFQETTNMDDGIDLNQ